MTCINKEKCRDGCNDVKKAQQSDGLIYCMYTVCMRNFCIRVPGTNVPVPTLQ